MAATTEPDERPRVRRWARLLGPVLWPSFLVAAVATAIFFAHIDPLTLRAQTLADWEISRQAGYTVGFLMFWAVCAASSALTMYLGATPVPDSPGPRSGR
ncbi:MAG: hypothetical protein U5K73_10380 [Halofilum sp. (in: g-proteobacteria)]|nr:hypothetical protein [Halofilum sp. (in: g-proteobacteria)]